MTRYRVWLDVGEYVESRPSENTPEKVREFLTRVLVDHDGLSVDTPGGGYAIIPAERIVCIEVVRL